MSERYTTNDKSLSSGFAPESLAIQTEYLPDGDREEFGAEYLPAEVAQSSGSGENLPSTNGLVERNRPMTSIE